MSEPNYSEDIPNWSMFYRRLCHLGPTALTGVPREWIPGLQSYARTGDLFWSDDLQAALVSHWDDPPAAVDQVMQVFVENVRLELREPPLCWGGSWRDSADTGGPMSMEDCIELIGFRLTAKLRRALVQAAQSRFAPSPCPRHSPQEKMHATP